jgi:hypothetical protein
MKEEYNFNPPNAYVLNFSKAFINNLIENGLKNFEITPSAEEGICFIFRRNNNVLYFEIYNDEEMGYIVEDEKKKIVIENKEISSEEEIIKVLQNFYKVI